jgi:hypothetical protein
MMWEVLKIRVGSWAVGWQQPAITPGKPAMLMSYAWI